MSSEMTETSRAILSELAALDSGQVGALPIAPDLYPEESLSAAIEAYADYCEISICQTSTERRPAFIEIRVLDVHQRDSRKIIGSFLSFLLEHATRLQLSTEAGK